MYDKFPQHPSRGNSTNDRNGPFAIRGCIIHCLSDPGEGNNADALEVFEDGALVVQDSKVVALGPADALLKGAGESIRVIDRRGRFIVPGFVDVHLHYVQTDMIAAYGRKLLDWLNDHTFPAEARFADPAISAETAAFFISELLRNGTTSALVMASVHKQSVTPLFEQARAMGMRLAAGKVMMDRNAPAGLLDTADVGYRESRELLERWHHTDRLSYAITPRFAPTSSEAQLRAAGRLAREFPDAYIHTHLAENRDGVAWVATLFPWSRSYLDVYDHFGLLRERSLYAHSIHLSDADRTLLAKAGAAAVFCPTSNLFLASGLFDYDKTHAQNVVIALGTDVGGGTSFSMIRTLCEAYKVAHLTGTALPPARLLYLATLAGAQALGVADRIGNLKVGQEADFLVLDPGPTPLMARRMSVARSIAEKLFALFMLGDDRCVESAWVYGVCRHSREDSRTTAVVR